MEITYNKSVPEKIVIELPFFSKYGSQYTKILNEQDCLIVTNYSFCRKIELTILAHATVFADGREPSNEKEFNKVLNEVLLELTSLANQSKELILQ